MPRYLSFILFLLSTIAITTSAVSSPDTNTLNMTSFYPVPTGTYEQIYLSPSPAKSLPCLPGMIYTNEDHPIFLEVCQNTSAGIVWTPLFGVWKKDHDDVFPADTATNANLRIGISTTTPEFKLSLDQDGGILTTGTFDAGTSLTTTGSGTRLFWYPRKAVYRAGQVTGSQWNETNLGTYSVVAGGLNNQASGFASVASFGENNSALSDYSTIIGGQNNRINTAIYGTIGGGFNNEVLKEGAVIGGGRNNIAGNDVIDQGVYSTICGGNTNIARGDYSTICGGNLNSATGTNSTICGGQNNSASGLASGISGGKDNTVNGAYSFVGGGNNNRITNDYSVILGGESNLCGGRYSTIGSGKNNEATGNYSTIWGGSNNTASGAYSIIPGGSNNFTGGAYSFAAGKNMQVTGERTFAWGYSDLFPVTITSSDAFIIYNTNVGIGLVDPSEQLHIKGGNVKIRGGIILTETPTDGIGSQRVKRDPTTKAIGLDIAEIFETSDDVYAGELLVADNTTPNKLTKSYQAYDSRFIGVVSSSPALVFKGHEIVLSTSAEPFVNGTTVPVALAGRVLCKVSNEGGSIEAGDLLTTSSLAGHAMKANDLDKSHGATIGKALEPFDFKTKNSKTGEIVILVGH